MAAIDSTLLRERRHRSPPHGKSQDGISMEGSRVSRKRNRSPALSGDNEQTNKQLRVVDSPAMRNAQECYKAPEFRQSVAKPPQPTTPPQSYLQPLPKSLKLPRIAAFSDIASSMNCPSYPTMLPMPPFDNVDPGARTTHVTDENEMDVIGLWEPMWSSSAEPDTTLLDDPFFLSHEEARKACPPPPLRRTGKDRKLQEERAAVADPGFYQEIPLPRNHTEVASCSAMNNRKRTPPQSWDFRKPNFVGKTEWKQLKKKTWKDLCTGEFVINCNPFIHMWSSSALNKMSQGHGTCQSSGVTHNLEFYLQRVHKADRKELQTHLDLAIAKGISFEMTHRFVWECGTERWARVQCKAQVNLKGTIDRLYGTVQDITRWCSAIGINKDSGVDERLTAVVYSTDAKTKGGSSLHSPAPCLLDHEKIRFERNEKDSKTCNTRDYNRSSSNHLTKEEMKHVVLDEDNGCILA